MLDSGTFIQRERATRQALSREGDLSGSLWLTVGGQELVLGAGELVHIPGGTVHGFKGTSDAPTQALILNSARG